MGRIVKNYFYNLIYQLLVFLVPLITAPYLTRTLGAYGTGVYEYVYSLTALICTVVMLGIFNYGSRQIAYVRDDKTQLNETFWRIMSARLLIALVGTAVYVVAVLIVRKYTNYFILYYTYLLGYFVDCTWVFVGVEDMKWAALKNILLKLFVVAGIFLFVRKPEDIGKYVFIQGGSILFANLLAYTQLRRYVGKPRFIYKGIGKDFKESVKLFLPSVAATFYLQCDKVMIQWLTGDTKQVSFYAYSEKIIMIPLSFITVLSAVMMPRIANEFSNQHKEKISALLNQGAKMSVFMAFPMMLGIAAVADKFVPWYLGEEFLPTVKAIVLISPIILTNTLSGISGTQYFTATNQIRILITSQFSAAAINIVVNALLIPRFGFMGAAVATVISSALCALIQYYYLVKQVKLPGLFTEALKYLLISGLMLVLVRLIGARLPVTIWATALQAAVGAIFYLFVCLVLKDKQLLSLLDIVKTKVRK